MIETMTSRERVIATFEHREPDCVPIDFSSTHNSGINVLAYNRLKKYLGIDTVTYMRDPIPMLASPDLEEGLEFLKLMGGDLLPLPRYNSFGITGHQLAGMDAERRVSLSGAGGVPAGKKRKRRPGNVAVGWPRYPLHAGARPSF